MSVTTRDYAMGVGGAWAESESGGRLEATSPATGESLGTVPEGTREDARRAIAAANAARRDWASLSAFDRAAAMNRVADLIEERRDDLARMLTLDQGKPLHAESYGEVEELVVYWRMAAEDATRLSGSMPPSVDSANRILAYRVPRGVVGVITPWNWPYTMPAELIAPALAAGNAVVWTPASSTSVCSVKLAECIVDAELPTGVFSMVTGPGSVVGDEVASSPGTQAVGFIGSIATGLKVATGAAGKATVLELGGNGPLVVLDDADIEAAAEASIAASFLCAGQSCTAGELFLVHEAVHDEFVERLRAAIERSVRLGDPLSEETTMGPLNNESTARKMDEHVADALGRGAELVVGGERASGFPTDLYWHATVLAEVTEEMDVAREETFGPVVPILRISSDEEALQIANSSPYGLLTAVWTRDLARGLRFAEAVDAGWVNINESTNYWESHLPFGGRAGKSSGVGRVGGSSVLEAFTEPKTVVVTLG
ncbi:MAG TPA: aldehyde dehydrogenase family protein [Gaiellaceae bacterium]|nr:aldehyde dehydrogenase family protein [Gaiellaceae bacterium]